MKNFKKRWKITSNWQLCVILIVFAITGSSSAKLAGPVTEFFGIQKDMGWYFYWPFRILIIFPIYQVILVAMGWLFGEFKFFWKFEKKMLKNVGLGKLITSSSEKSEES